MTVTILEGDALKVLRTMPSESAQCCVTSPPYWGLRDYGVEGQLGLEASPNDYVDRLVGVFREVRRVLRADGTLWLNLGDSYATGTTAPRKPTTTAGGRVPASWSNRCDSTRAGTPPGLKTKDLIGIPWRVAFALQADGWYLRSDIIWAKPNPAPGSATDRPTTAHEYVFLLSRSARYHYDADAIRDPLSPKTLTTYRSRRRSKGTDARGKVKADNLARSVPERRPRLKADGTPAGANKQSVWTVATHSFKGAHFATFPPKLIEPCIKAGCHEGGTVLDPFGGAGTTGMVADRLGRNAVLIELNPEYAEMARERIKGDAPLFAEVV